jgi:hypothetical protein
MSMQQFYPLYQQQLDPTNLGMIVHQIKTMQAREILELYYTPGDPSYG